MFENLDLIKPKIFFIYLNNIFQIIFFLVYCNIDFILGSFSKVPKYGLKTPF